MATIRFTALPNGTHGPCLGQAHESNDSYE